VDLVNLIDMALERIEDIRDVSEPDLLWS